MFIDINNDAIRFTGRWDMGSEVATTTAPGGMIEVAFEGTFAVLHFDIERNEHPYPHIWVSVDDGARVELAIDHVIRVEACEPGNHTVKIIYKSAVEIHHRWYQPLIGKITFKGADVEKAGVLPEDNRKIIEYIGDSITEGLLVDIFYRFEKDEYLNRVFQDDSTATYAYLTAMKLGFKPVIMGYGGVGLTKSGNGSVPNANESYLYNFNGSPVAAQNANVVVINHGTNDRSATTEKYLEEYTKLLKTARIKNPDAKIVVLTPFCGAFDSELREFVPKFNEENNENIYLISSLGWIPAEPLHPLRDGHRIVSEHLCEELKKIL